jgi:hypothetical protein
MLQVLQTAATADGRVGARRVNPVCRSAMHLNHSTFVKPTVLLRISKSHLLTRQSTLKKNGFTLFAGNASAIMTDAFHFNPHPLLRYTGLLAPTHRITLLKSHYRADFAALGK